MSQEAERMQAELNALIDAYDVQRSKDAAADLRACLPPTNHPLYRDARCELVRIDLEYGWHERRARQLDDYFQMFPDLRADRAGVQQIAFEEYRLRVLAGEHPSALEYERRYGVTTADWPGSDVEFGKMSQTMVVQHAEMTRDAAQDTTTAPINTPPFDWDLFEGRLNDALAGAGTPQVRGTSPAGLGRPARRSSEIAQALLQDGTSQSSDEANFLLAQVLSALPEVGTRFLKFQLIAELGRGGFGRVYLAHQGDLANRLVALKITVDLPGEEEKLAQLQHTNVVPIFSVHRAGALHAVCMPFFGPTTLADLIHKLDLANRVPKSGGVLVETLHALTAEFRAKVHKTAGDTASLGAASAVGSAVPQTLKTLGAADYVDAVLHLMERVTEGLEHAHERGILHGDLKPANILLTVEGQPMLLDFNLATDVKARAGLGELRVGGTLPYMAPEHLAALKGGDRKEIDARSDLYSVGVIFYELLTGRLPFDTPRGPLAKLVPGLIAERRKGPPSVRRFNRAISPAVESLVRQCLEPDPRKRYQTAKDLHEDLQLHRQHFPLRHAAEPSVRERARKWVRRHPRLTSPMSIAALSLLFFAVASAPFAWQRWEDYQTERRNLAADANKAWQATKKAHKQREAAEVSAELAKKETDDANFRAQRARLQIEALNTARQFHQFHVEASIARDLTDCVNLVRLRPETWPMEHARLEESATQARQLLQRYRVLEQEGWDTQPSIAVLADAEQTQLREDVAAILFALAHAEQFRADRLLETWDQGASALAALAAGRFGFSALSIPDALVLARPSICNKQAQCCFRAVDMPRALLVQQADLTRLLGDPAGAARVRKEAERRALHEHVEDRYWTACALATRGDFKQAKLLLAEATRRTPDHFGVWHLLALCHQAAGEFRDAEACFSTCTALRPEPGWIHYHRGLVSLRLGKWPDARKDFDVFIKKYPEFREAYVQRATAFEGSPDLPKAIQSLTRAIHLDPASAPALYYRRAQLKERYPDTKGAAADRALLRNKVPTSVDDWLYRGMVRADDAQKLDGAQKVEIVRKRTEIRESALADFEHALASDDNNVLALYQKALLLADDNIRRVEAIGALNRILLPWNQPDHVEARVMRGRLYAKLGVRAEAVRDAEEAIKRDPRPARYYEAARIYALASREEPTDAKRAVDLLAHALRNGVGAKTFQSEPDLQPLRNFPAYRRLVANFDLLDPAPPPRVRP